MDLCIHGYGGLAVFPVLCLEDPDFIHELHDLHLEYALRNVRALLPEIKDYVDIVGTDADDWGNQKSLSRIFQCAVKSHGTSVGKSEQAHPGKVAPPGTARRDGGGNKAVQALREKAPSGGQGARRP